MSKYNSIKNLALNLQNLRSFEYHEELNELIPLMELMEKVNPCDIEYEIVEGNIIVSYYIKLNLFNFVNLFPLKAKVQIIGLPISISKKGYLGKPDAIIETINKRKGLKVLLNGDTEFKNGGRTLSTFVFYNEYETFHKYLGALRSPYRRRINKALEYRTKMVIKPLERSNFNKEHYNLYLSIMKRTQNPLETLPMEFFIGYEAELYEFIDKNTNKVIGFIQLKEIKDTLYFMFGGFKQEDIANFDIYYNMLLKIIEIGIEKQVKIIEFGQTAEESKFKIGCKEQSKYLYVHHSNPIINNIIKLLVPLFSYKPYEIKHHVFKNNQRLL